MVRAVPSVSSSTTSASSTSSPAGDSTRLPALPTTRSGSLVGLSRSNVSSAFTSPEAAAAISATRSVPVASATASIAQYALV
jgi:hypothetical protein